MRDPFAGRTLLILNPAAGSEDPAWLRRQLGGAFAVRRAPFDLVETGRAGDAQAAAAEAVRLGYRAVVAIGGDGTIAEAISGLAGTDTPLGIIPQGTGNQVAANLGIPRTLEAAVDVAVNGMPVPMDLGRLADGRYFALMAGAGWDAQVMSTATRQLKLRWGFGAYLYAGLRQAVPPPSISFRITADGHTLEVQAATVIIANIGYLAYSPFPGVSIGPAVSFQDGLLDVCIFAPRTIPDLAAVAWRMVSGQYAGDERMIYLQGREVTVESDPPLVTQVDGDLVGGTPLEARAVPGGVRVLVPTGGA